MKRLSVVLMMSLALGCAKKESSSSSPKNDSPAPQEQPKPTPAPAPTPTPPVEVDPSQVTAIRATSWANVKYAFCSAQGSYGVLVDFQGTDLSANRSGGNFVFGVRGCSGTKPFKWGKVLPFAGTLNQGTLVLDFGTSLMPPNCYGCSRDRIEVSSQLGAYTSGYGVLGGNSGPCAFLQNKATGGVFSSDTGFRCQ